MSAKNVKTLRAAWGTMSFSVWQQPAFACSTYIRRK